jgi:4-hydroxybenzoate polyprenyltransferase
MRRRTLVIVVVCLVVFIALALFADPLLATAVGLVLIVVAIFAILKWNNRLRDETDTKDWMGPMTPL